MLSDSQIAAMSAVQRQDLMRRLSTVPGAAWRRPRGRGGRGLHVVAMMATSAFLVPWIIYLGAALPERYVTHNWNTTWVGFDSFLLVFTIATAVLGYVRHPLLPLTAVATGVLLLADAWFDFMLSNRAQAPYVALTALAFEVPMAALLVYQATRLVAEGPSS